MNELNVNQREKSTKIEVEPIHVKQKGDYVRTHRDSVEENNLLELPILYKKKWQIL